MSTPDPQLPEPAARRAAPREFDVRCDHRLVHPPAGQCQLWAGHDGEHAAMFACAGRRLVRTWTDDPADASDRSSDYESLPWLRGYPRPGWTE